jgi:hypothetical protein
MTAAGGNDVARGAGRYETSRYLPPRALRGIDRLGDVLLPGDGALPRFSSTGCVTQVDRIAAYVPPADLRDLSMALRVLGWLPALLVRLAWALLDRSGRMPTALGALLRFARFGLKGLVNSLYFDDPTVLAALEYEVSVFEDDVPPAAR